MRAGLRVENAVVHAGAEVVHDPTMPQMLPRPAVGRSHERAHVAGMRGTERRQPRGRAKFASQRPPRTRLPA